jgi:hypothetical protein
MREFKRKVRLLVRSAGRTFFTALPGLAALVFSFHFLSLTTPASRNPSSPCVALATTLTAPVTVSMVDSLPTSHVRQSPKSLAIPGKPVVAAWEWAKRRGKGADYFNKMILNIVSSESRAYFGRLTKCGINRLYLQVGAKGGKLTYNGIVSYKVPASDETERHRSLCPFWEALFRKNRESREGKCDREGGTPSQ